MINLNLNDPWNNSNIREYLLVYSEPECNISAYTIGHRQAKTNKSLSTSTYQTIRAHPNEMKNEC